MLRSAGRPLRAILALALGAGAMAGAAAEKAANEAPSYSRQGADTCLRCHDTPHVLELFRTPHAERGDPDAPFTQLQCESCHGPGGEHAARLRPGQERPPIRNFGGREPVPLAEQNGVCLECHEGDMGAGWHGSAHDPETVACADCHISHARRDPMVAGGRRQSETCYTCHASERAELQRAFRHPVRSGELTCGDCHAVHASATPALLDAPGLNESCYGCHEEKRGPFLWEHVPVAEDCSTCHRPHGSNHRGLLTKAAPLLCQDCHSRAGHPSLPRTGRGLAGAQPSQFLVGGSCTNCHARVHGSNHPSGANLTR